jgi:hypothetical protein
MIALENKYDHFLFVPFHARLLRVMFFLRFIAQNHDLLLLADVLTEEAKVSGSPSFIQPDLSKLFMAKAYE